MKRMKPFLLLLALTALIYQLGISYSQSGVGIGLQLSDTTGPIVNLVQPINNSGNLNGNITFFYNASDANSISNCSLIINNTINSTDNSITKDTSMSFKLNHTALGIYSWNINCTDSLGFVGESPKRAVIVAFLTNFNGTTTNLSLVDIRNVTNFVVETAAYGKINFSEGVDLSQGLDLNKHINMSFNRIELNSTALQALNKSAILQITGLTFSNPRILFDGNLCPNDICKKVSYSGGALLFNVTHFTVFSSEETPGGGGDTGTGGGSSGGGGGGGSGGGGGGGGPPAIPIVTDFSIDKSSLKVVLKQGQTKTETISIKNIGTTIFDVRAYLQELEKFKIYPELHEVVTTLNPDEERKIELTFKALENEKPDIYTAEISFSSPSVEKKIPAIVEVDSAEPLFDVDVEVLTESKQVLPGEELLLEVNLFNVRGFGRVDVKIEYAIKDLKGNMVASEHETLAVETQAKFSRALAVPSDLRPGNYVAFAKVIYGDSIGTSSDLFEVKAKVIRLYPIAIKDYKLILLIGGIAALAGILIFSSYKYGYLKKKAPATKVEEAKQLREEDKAQKLKKELEALESAYKSGFISEESYQRSKKRIEEKLNNLK